MEDKTYSSHHSNQLARYKENAEKWCENNNYEKPICIYLKTGNESQSGLVHIKNKALQFSVGWISSIYLMNLKILTTMFLQTFTKD
ncbi:hypothetical protein [Chryseobacterium sp. MOF25P]|uniref:hypothetical protein n=1 Tax=Chryseobacterium sp. MOF25P TaxID=1664318 RepID=UPI0021CD42E5|nr:hypothetical protein [Chryseobacterium sp. MOF25P]